jgi:hypothetical protein
MGKSDPRNVCDGCGLSFDKRRRPHVEYGPMVRERIWARLTANHDDCLCCECMDRRARERLGRRLRRADLLSAADLWNTGPALRYVTK